MQKLETQIEKTKQIVNSGCMPVTKGRISIKETPYEVILENQLIILEILKKILP